MWAAIRRARKDRPTRCSRTFLSPVTVAPESPRAKRTVVAALLAQRMRQRAPKRVPTRVQPRREGDGREVRPRVLVGVRGVEAMEVDPAVPMVEATRVWLPLCAIAEEDAPT